MSPKKIVFLIIIIISLLIINNLAHSIYSLWQKKHLVVDARSELEKQKKENDDLKKKLSVIEKPQFIEEEARNKLFLAKPGDNVIVVSQKDLEASVSSKLNLPDKRPNWEKWWDLFF